MNTPKTIASFLWHFLKRQPLAFFIAALASVIWSINEVFFPYFIKLIINTVSNFKGQPSAIYSALLFPLIALVSCWLTMEICIRTQGIVLVSAFPRFRANIREAAYNYTKHHSHEYFSNNFAGSIAKKIADLPTSCQTVMEILLFNINPVFFQVVI